MSFANLGTALSSLTTEYDKATAAALSYTEALGKQTEQMKASLAEFPKAAELLASLAAQYEGGVLSLEGYIKALQTTEQQLSKMAALASGEARESFQRLTETIREFIAAALAGPTPRGLNQRLQEDLGIL